MPTVEEQKAEEQRLEAEQVEADKKAADEALAQFEAGFSGKDLPEPTEKPNEPPPATEEVKTEPEAEKAEEPEVVEAPKVATVTEEQLNRLLAYGTTIEEIKTAMEKQFGTAFGKMGGLERVIKDLQSSTPVGQPITVTEADLEELKGEFPDLTDKLAKGLTRILSKFKGTGTAPATFDETQITPIVEQRVNEAKVRIKEELAKEQLADLYPDWQEIVGPKDANTKYRQWLLKQPVEYQKKIAESWSPYVVADSIDRFREATEKKAPPVKPTPKDQRKERLAEAVPQRGTPGVKATPSDEEQFLAGYNETIKGN